MITPEEAKSKTDDELLDLGLSMEEILELRRGKGTGFQVGEGRRFGGYWLGNNHHVSARGHNLDHIERRRDRGR